MPDELITKEGTILESLPNTMFRVRMDPENQEQEQQSKTVLAMVSGKMRRYFIKITPGDRVKVVFSPTDLNRGRIIYRYK
jgi:translation initiation factor IF-1